jgi:hypothetical protein
MPEQQAHKQQQQHPGSHHHPRQQQQPQQQQGELLAMPAEALTVVTQTALHGTATQGGGSSSSSSFTLHQAQKTQQQQQQQQPVMVLTDITAVPAEHAACTVGGAHVKVAEGSALGGKSSRRKTCIVCMDRLRDVVLLPCNHFKLCSVCAQQMEARGVLDCCPYCRKPCSMQRVYR